MHQQEVPENGTKLYPNHDLLDMRNPLLSSTAAPPDGDSCDFPPPLAPVSDAGFSIHTPPVSGYVAGCYLPSPPRPILPPLGHYTYSYGGAVTGASSMHSFTSCPSYPQFGAPFASDAGCSGASSYSMFPSPYTGGFNGTIPPLHHPLSDPNVSSTSDSPLSRKRRRAREEEELNVDDSNIPAKKIGATLGPEMGPTPPGPDSGSDRSDSISPLYPVTVPPSRPQIPTPLPPPSLSQNGVTVTLAAKCEDMWNLFYAANTEMIVTKNGRCLFPILMFGVTGLSRKKDYNIYIRAVNNDQYRYKFLQNAWTQVAESDFTHDETRMISKHSNSPQSGGKWMGKDVDFKSLKITHYPKSKNGDILLNTMHKYFFELVVEEHLSDCEPLAFPFHLTRFIAVTAYQSAKLTELKKEKNPFARGVKNHDSDALLSPPRQPIYQPQYMPYTTAPAHPICTDSGASVPYPTPWSQQQ